MNSLGREGGQANGNVLGAFVRGRILDPLSSASQNGLSGANINAAVFVAHAQASSQDQRVFVEFRSLSRLVPSCRTAHVGHTDTAFAVVHAAHIFINDFGKVPGRLHACGIFNQRWHANFLPMNTRADGLSIQCGRWPPIMEPRSIFRYPAGGWKSAAGCAPSLTLLSSKVSPADDCALIGENSLWSMHAVLVVPF